MQHLFDVIDSSRYTAAPTPEAALIRSERDWLVRGLTDGINRERIGTQYKQVTKKSVACRLNSHPIYAKNIAEVRVLLEKCERDGFKWYWILTKTHRVPSGE